MFRNTAIKEANIFQELLVQAIVSAVTCLVVDSDIY
jgi:hypothetical protein